MPPLDAPLFAPRRMPPPLPADEIHVWRFSAAAGSPRAVGEAARSALQHLLARYADRPGPIAIERGAHGKPFAPDLPELAFNLSHAGHEILLAFARGQALGIDLESAVRRNSIDGIARRFFAAAEADALDRLDEPLQQAAFLRLWTHKEAVLKALGAGLSFGLDRIEFALDAGGEVAGLSRVAAEAGAPWEWQLRQVDPAPALFGTLAWRGPPRAVRTFALAP